MPKRSRRDRKNFNAGQRLGYAEGYAKGLYDGNPFNKMIEALSSLATNLSECMKDPEVRQALLEMNERAKEEQDELYIEGGDDE